MFLCLPNSAWADRNLAEVAVQLGNMVEPPSQSQPNPGLRADESPCKVVQYVVAEIRNMKIEGLVTETDALFRHESGKRARGLGPDGTRVGKPYSSCLLESNLLEWIERVI